MLSNGHYYMALLNAVGRSVHLHGPSRLPVVNYVRDVLNNYNYYCLLRPFRM